MSDAKKTLDTIRKLLAHADSAEGIGNADEAAAFAAKASELLLKHKLSMSDVELLVEEDGDPIENDYIDISAALGLSTNKREPWLTSLTSAVAKAHFCVALYVSRSKKVRLVGHKSDREIAVYLTTVLAQTARKLANEYAREVKRTTLAGPDARFLNYGRGWLQRDTNRVKAAFLVGFVSEVGARLKEMRKDVEQKGGQYALVRFGKIDADVKRAAAPFTGKGRNTLSYGDSNAYNAGKQAGRNVSLHGGLGGGNSSRGTLSRGALLLGR